jgi:saccharopine dehydrogenase-like NADP-dependent oxidoreductase
VGKAKVSPRAVLQAVLARQPKVSWDGEPDEYEVVRAVVRGVEGGELVEHTVDCHTPGIPTWGFGVDVDTGCPPSIVMQMLARGQITGRGTLPPEVAVPAEPFFAELLKRGMTVRRSRVVLGSGAKPKAPKAQKPPRATKVKTTKKISAVKKKPKKRAR